MTRFLKWAAIAGGLTAMAAALGLVGLEVPKPEWQADHDIDIKLVQGNINNVDRLITLEVLGAVQLQVYQNMREQDLLRKTEGQVPDYLLKEQER